MANQESVFEGERLLDIGVAEKSALYRFYLNWERPIVGTIAVFIFMAVWEVVGNTPKWLRDTPFINPLFMSSPAGVFRAGVTLFSTGEIYKDLWVSFQEFGIGYGLAVILGVPFGLAVGWYKRLNYVTDPFISAMNATPRVAFLPLIIIWLGIGIMSKVGIVFLGAIFSILINTMDGVKTTDHRLLTAARSFGASEFQTFKTVVLPSCLPFILTGLRLAVGRALIGVMVGEMYAATAGIGFMITVAGATFQTDKVFVGVLVFCLGGLISMDILSRIERRLERWRPRVGAA
jgi:NitT/TauT family transport system permease protein